MLFRQVGAGSVISVGRAAIHSLAIACAGAGLVLQFPRGLEWKVYRSPDGEYSLIVDPLDRSGRSGARQSLVREGEVIWSEGLGGLVVRDAEVTDEGVVCAVARREGQGRAEICILTRGPEAERASESVVPCEWDSSRGVWVPWCDSIFLLPDREEFGVSLCWGRGPGGRAEVWVFGLADGQRRRKGSVGELFGRDEGSGTVEQVLRVPGREETVVWWIERESVRGLGRGVPGALFTVVDPEGNSIWRKEFPRDYQAPQDHRTGGSRFRDEELLSRARASGVLGSDGEGRFFVCSVGGGKRYRFQVLESEDGEVRVVETAVEDWRVDGAGTDPGWTEIELERRGAVALDLGAVAGRDVDALGRLLVQDPDSGGVRALASDGKILASWGSGGWEPSSIARMVVDPLGDLYVQTGYGSKKRVLGSVGEGREPSSLFDVPGFRVSFVPGGEGAAWVAAREPRFLGLRSFGVDRLPSGVEVARTRGGSWFDHIFDAVATGDGGVVVLSEVDGQAILGEYGPRGQAGREFLLPSSGRLIVNEDWYGVAGHGAEVLLIERASGQRYRWVRSGAEAPQGEAVYGFAVGSNEILALEQSPMRVLRWRLP